MAIWQLHALNGTIPRRLFDYPVVASLSRASPRREQVAFTIPVASLVLEEDLMRSIRLFLMTLAVVAFLSGCATGMKYSAMATSIPKLKAGQGRVFFFRSASPIGAVVQPSIRLNGTTVGRSQPGGFFYVDLPPGKYEAATATETEHNLTFVLQPGEIKYVRSIVSVGVFVGRVTLYIESSENARSELLNLSYTETGAAAAITPQESAQQDGETNRRTTLDDLKGLLPAN